MKPTVGKVVTSSLPAGYLCQTLNSVLPPSQSLSGMLSESKRLQHKLSAESAKTEATYLIENAASLRDGARFSSLQGKGAGSWLSAIPTSGKFALKPCEFRLGAYLRLGLPLPLCDNIQSCECGRVTSDSSGYHQMVCKTGGPVWSHKSITSVWPECLNDLKSIIEKSQKIGMPPLIVAQTSLFSTQALAPMLSWIYHSHILGVRTFSQHQPLRMADVGKM